MALAVDKLPRNSKAEKAASYSDKEARDKFFVIMLIEAVAADDRPAFYYLAIKENMLGKFKKISEKKQDFDLADYGSVVASGYGQPSPEVLEYMEANFGFNHAAAPRLRMTPEGLKEVRPDPESA